VKLKYFYYGFLIPHGFCCGVSSYPTLEKGGVRGDYKNKVYLKIPRRLCGGEFS